MKEKKIYDTRTLSEWELQKQIELNHRKKKKTQCKRIFFESMFCAILGLISIPIMLTGWFWKTISTISLSNLGLLILFEGVFLITCIILVNNTYKEYKRQSQMYNTLEDSINLKSEIQEAVNSYKQKESD